MPGAGWDNAIPLVRIIAPMSEVAQTTADRTWMCVVCGFIYDEAAGLPEEGIAPLRLELLEARQEMLLAV